MSEGKRRRRDSGSPPPPARSRKGGYDTWDDGPTDGGDHKSRHDRNRDYDRDREMERDWDREKDRERGGGGGGGSHSNDRSYECGGGGGEAGSGRTGRAAGKEEPSYEVGGSRHSHRERDRERDRDKDHIRREGRRERDDRVGGGMKREALQVNGDDGEGHGRRDGDAAGGNGDGREMRRERGHGRDPNQLGRGGPEASRYVSAEERKERQRQAEEEAKPKAPKEEPNLGLSGKLAAETNKVAGGVELKHVPPPEARLPDKRWRLYIFKNDQLQDEPYRIHRMDHYLFGRDMHVADIITAHPSCSKQHAVLQFRLTQKDDEFGRPVSAVRPYLIDLGSVNGTFLNGDRLEALRYYELLEKDVVRLGQSTREYVLLHDKSGDEQAA